MEPFVPSSGRILEVGCGYGVFSCHLALASRQRHVLGVDVDVDKVVHAEFAAKQARAKGARCEFHLSPPGEVPPGPWDAVVIVDVLYLLDADAQAGLLQSCAEQLALGGVLVVKEMATTPRWKARWNAVQETLAVRVLRITAGEGLTFLDPDVLGAWMAEQNLTVTHHRIDRGYPHPHHLIIGARRKAIASDSS
jgi:2-polyprenyl-3-methyl-5-hydroxy-6-metoxy-1,4-benzoquinol methylase